MREFGKVTTVCYNSRMKARFSLVKRPDRLSQVPPFPVYNLRVLVAGCAGEKKAGGGGCVMGGIDEIG